MKSERYECPDCRQSIEVGVKLVQLPTHTCPQRANKVKPMQLVGEPSPE
jgi:hypothetical protein